MRINLLVFLLLFVALIPGQVFAGQQAQKKIVILYASIGNGHKSAAMAIKEQVMSLSTTPVSVEILDVLDFAPSWVKNFIITAYNFATQNTPEVYDWHFLRQLNQLSDLESLGKSTGASYFRRSKALIEKLKQTQPDIIFSTFNHTTEGLIDLKNSGVLPNTIIASTLTDYVSHPYYAMMIEESDMTFVPSNLIRDYYTDLGVNPKKVQVSMIPVSQNLERSFTYQQRVQKFSEYWLDPNKKTVLIASGANGVGNYRQIINSIVHSQYIRKNNPLQLIVVAGRNARNQRHAVEISENLNQFFASNLNIVVHPLVPLEQMHDFIKMSDVVITKAGGLTSTELAVAGKPAILLDINGGQERYNIKFFNKLGGVKSTSNQKMVGRLLDQILQTPGELERMSKAQLKTLTDGDGSHIIAKWMVNSGKGPGLPSGHEGLNISHLKVANTGCLDLFLRMLPSVRFVQ